MAEDMREMTVVLLEKGNQQMDCLTIALLQQVTYYCVVHTENMNKIIISSKGKYI